jgi:hypothetical protein
MKIPVVLTIPCATRSPAPCSTVLSGGRDPPDMKSRSQISTPRTLPAEKVEDKPIWQDRTQVFSEEIISQQKRVDRNDAVGFPVSGPVVVISGNDQGLGGPGLESALAMDGDK